MQEFPGSAYSRGSKEGYGEGRTRRDQALACRDYCGNDGGHGRDRTDDLFHATAPIKCTFNNLQAVGDCQTTRKYAEGGYLTGDFAGENEQSAWAIMGREDLSLRPPGHELSQCKSQVLYLVSLRDSVSQFLSRSIVPSCTEKMPLPNEGDAAFVYQSAQR